MVASGKVGCVQGPPELPGRVSQIQVVGIVGSLKLRLEACIATLLLYSAGQSSHRTCPAQGEGIQVTFSLEEGQGISSHLSSHSKEYLYIPQLS